MLVAFFCDPQDAPWNIKMQPLGHAVAMAMQLDHVLGP